MQCRPRITNRGQRCAHTTHVDWVTQACDREANDSTTRRCTYNLCMSYHANIASIQAMLCNQIESSLFALLQS